MEVNNCACVLGVTVKINIYEQQLITKIQNNQNSNQFSFNPRLTLVAQSIVNQFYKKSITHPKDARQTIRKLFPMVDSMKEFLIISQIDSEKEWESNLIDQAEFVNVLSNHQLNNFGLGILKLRSNKMIVVAIFAEINSNKLVQYANEITPSISGKIIDDFDKSKFVEVINIFREKFKLSSIILNNDLQNDVEVFQKLTNPSLQDFIDHRINLFSFKTGSDIVLSCMSNAYFISILLSPIKSLGVVYQNVNSEKSNILLKLEDENIEAMIKEEINSVEFHSTSDSASFDFEKESKDQPNDEKTENKEKIEKFDEVADEIFADIEDESEKEEVSDVVPLKTSVFEKIECNDQTIENAEEQTKDEVKEKIIDEKSTVEEEAKPEEVKSEVVKQEEVKSEEVKSEEVKQEEVKQEEAKPEEAKSEEVKSEEVKSEETKPEKVKSEETKPEEVKQEEVKSEETKSEEVKPEEAKSEEAKPEKVKQEEVKSEETKSEEVKPEEAKSEEAKPEKVKQEEVKSEEVKPEEAKSEEAKPEKVKQEEVKSEEPKVVHTQQNQNSNRVEQRGECVDPADCVNRFLSKYNKIHHLPNSPLNQEAVEKLKEFMDHNYHNIAKIYRASEMRNMFSKFAPNTYLRSVLISDKKWKEISDRIKPNGKHGEAIFAIHAIRIKNDNPKIIKFTLIYLLHQIESDDQYDNSSCASNSSSVQFAPEPKTPITKQEKNIPTPKKTPGNLKKMPATPAPQKIDRNYSDSAFRVKGNQQKTAQTPGRKNAVQLSQETHRYDDPSHQLEYDIRLVLKSIIRDKPIPLNEEVSNKLREYLKTNQGDFHQMQDVKIKEHFQNEIDYAWARIIIDDTAEEIKKKIRTQYEQRFPHKLLSAQIVGIACIPGKAPCSFTLSVITGNKHDPNKPPRQPPTTPPPNNKKSSRPTTPLGNRTFSTPGNDSSVRLTNSKSSKKHINDFERTHMFEEMLNEYRESIDKPPLKLSDKILEPAKHYARDIGTSMCCFGPDYYVKEAENIPGVSNASGIGILLGKSNNYVERSINKILNDPEYKNIIDNAPENFAIGYWNDPNNNVSISFIFAEIA